MKHQKIDDSAHVWIVTRGPDGRLHEEIDAGLVASLHDGLTSEEITELLVAAAGAAEVAETRAW